MPSKKKQRPATKTPLILVGVGVALILGAFGWYAYLLNQAPAASEITPIAEDNYPDIARISVGDAKAAYDTSQAVFLDVRDAQAFAERHIPGAISIPLAELPQRISELNTQAWIITY